MQRNGSSAPAEVVVLTGAASGVGLATAGRLGIDGAGLALVDDGDALALARRSLEGDSAAVIATIEADASDATIAVRTIEARRPANMRSRPRLTRPPLSLEDVCPISVLRSGAASSK
jgi:NAD(P)-dependent dehydrogenase (short-subunit alcohol dehydrogenase family)